MSDFFIISAGADGVAKVVQAYGAPDPAFAMWPYRAQMAPVSVYQYDNNVVGTKMRDLSRGVEQLPLP